MAVKSDGIVEAAVVVAAGMVAGGVVAGVVVVVEALESSLVVTAR